MQQDIVARGVELMLFGMGTVVVFLALLVMATIAMSALMSRFSPAPQSAVAGTKAASTAVTEADAEVVAAITAAVHQYRNR